MRTALILLVILLGSCGGSVDEDALRARIREEVLEEQRVERERRNEATHRDAEIPPELPAVDVDRFRVDASTGPHRGATDPVVTIVTFTDYQCPFCRRVQPAIARILDEHPNDVRLVFRNNPLPFHLNAVPAAQAALEAYAQGGDPLFWRMHDLLFENNSALSRADLEGYGRRLGLDASSLSSALNDGRHRDRIDADQAVAARLGARGTPAFFINGRPIMGAQPFDAFDAIVREEIRIAQRLMEGGTPRSQVYARLQQGARAEPVHVAPRDAPPQPRMEPDSAAVYRVPVDGRPQVGPSNALITLVMFSDLQCPFCARVQPTIERLRTTYGRDLRVVHRHNPLVFHRRAMPAAEVAEEVFTRRGGAAFFRFTELCYTHAERNQLEDDDLIRYAAQVGVRARWVRAALADHRHRATVEADQQLANALGARGTPAFFINGRNLRGARPYASFQALIDELLPVARARVASGTRAADLYEALTRDGATTPQLVPARQAPPRPPPDHVYVLPVPAHAPTRGPSSAPVTIQIFSDFQCPFCNRARPTIEQVVSQFGGQVRLVWRDYPLPFHDNAMPAAEAAREVFAQAGNDAFWRYNALLFENQRDLAEGELIRLARTIDGIDASRVQRALSDHRHRAVIEADVAAIEDAGARIGTPSFFINGRHLQGAQPIAVFETAIRRALAP